MDGEAYRPKKNCCKKDQMHQEICFLQPLFQQDVFLDAVVYLSLLRRSVVEEWQIQRQKVLVTWVVTPTRLHSVKRVSFCLCYAYTYIFWLTCTYTLHILWCIYKFKTPLPLLLHCLSSSLLPSVVPHLPPPPASDPHWPTWVDSLSTQ